MTALRLLAEFDRLFERVVMDPGAWDDRAFGEWVDAALDEPFDRDAAKIVQRALRRAQRLQRYWAAHPGGPADWRMRVDEALGSAGWRPGLDILEWGLSVEPDPELFDAYAERFRAVKFTPLDMTYEEWLSSRKSQDAGPK
jgi:hypothetical protein